MIKFTQHHKMIPSTVFWEMALLSLLPAGAAVAWTPLRGRRERLREGVLTGSTDMVLTLSLTRLWPQALNTLAWQSKG